ncbi:MAG: replication-associated recombination protein A [Rhodospirillaceae bacterium]|nr:replication-associated recombination protein A [Rhodospirillaceae bacterium]
MNTLFESQAPRPLADRLRPARLEEVVGQDHLLGVAGPIGRMVAQGRMASMILWGPPGAGKTTIARLLAEKTDLVFEPVSAVFAGVADLRKIFERARARRKDGLGTLLFVDEIHRFNKAQQDALLPFVEDGTVVLVGATTENPSFEVNAALTSRCQVMVLNRLSDDALDELLGRAEALQGRALPLDDDARVALTGMADGDGRFLLNITEELLALEAPEPLNRERLAEVVQRRVPVYDKADEGHYNLISALHKSVRGSDPDASLYWLARMFAAGEDPLFVARCVVRMAIEDIGMADPGALTQAIAAKDTYDFLGTPEGELAIAQAVVYCATAPKSNAAYKAFGAAMRSAKESGSLTPPKIILNAPTRMMKDMGFGAGYDYDHDAPGAFSGQNYFPDELPRERFYKPVERGFEREITKRLDYWAKLREKRGGED